METTTDGWLSADDTVVTINLGKEPNDRLAYAPVLELYHPIMSALGEYGGQ